jgi:hypothetical protein
MPRWKKPDAPKFEPVTIAGIRPAAYALGLSEAERSAMVAEDTGRIALQKTIATMARLEALQNHLGISGKFGPADNLLALLVSIANKYVEGFEIKVGDVPKRGVKKVADRFKTVTEIDSVKILQNLPSTAAAIDIVATNRRPAIRSQELSAKYYRCLDEIKANEQANELLLYWRQVCNNRPDLAQDSFFDSMFWTIERDQLGATLPHNVMPLKARKR